MSYGREVDLLKKNSNWFKHIYCKVHILVRIDSNIGTVFIVIKTKMYGKIK